MLQQKVPQDFVIATGEFRSVRDFVNTAAKCLDMSIEWRGEGLSEVGVWLRDDGVQNEQEIIRVDAKYYRPTEVEALLGDASKAQSKLG